MINVIKKTEDKLIQQQLHNWNLEESRLVTTTNNQQQRR